ncbi:MAG TPA: TaqI-like C-terminal specificity domain-containing protein, partial [Ignavibacteria bacterium]
KYFRFLNGEMINNFDELFNLFHKVLAVPQKARIETIKQIYSRIPYLNSSLFEISELEEQTITINSIGNSNQLELINSTILKEQKKKSNKLPTLDYLFKFLDSYDFSSEGTEDIQEDVSRTLINASVLGKVFEKINGYKDGSIFTPGFITMYMCKQSIRLAVLQKFKEKYGWKMETFDDLKNYLADRKTSKDILEFNALINSLRLCDPAVGSGHFLVSSLNEIIAIKYELGLLADDKGIRITDYEITIENDELIITDRHGDIFQYHLQNGKPVSKEMQRLQITLFHEKQTIIENCLFGVDINPNSVKICRLRLWIELLKNAYYKEPDYSELETLPNIDINIKCGNSLLSRFPLDSDLSKALKSTNYSVEQYREYVSKYKNERNRDIKRDLQKIIYAIKNDLKTNLFQLDPKRLTLIRISGELRKIMIETNLFGESIKQIKEKKENQRKLEIKIKKLTNEIDEIKMNAIYKNSFEWRFEFPEVLNDKGDFEGFDVIISNPPYGVSIKRNGNYEYASQYSEILSGELETYILFYYKGLKLLNVNGLLSYVTPDGWFTNRSASLYRNWLKNNYDIIDVFDFYKPFVDAKDMRCHSILLSSLNSNLEIHIQQVLPSNQRIIYRDYTISQTTIKSFGKNEWRFYITNEERNIFLKMENNSKPLEQLYNIKYGLRTGDNNKYISEIKTKYPVIAGADIADLYLIDWKPKYLKTIEGLPKGYFDEYYSNKKVIIQYVRTNNLSINARWLECAYNKGNHIPLNSLNYIYKKYPNYEIKYVLAILNSFLMNRYYRAYYTDVNVKPTYLSQLPIPDISQQQPIIDLVDKILESKQQGKDSTEYEKKIDELVYKLYDITPEEQNIIENN